MRTFDLLVTFSRYRGVFSVSEPIKLHRTTLKDDNANVKGIKDRHNSKHCINGNSLQALLDTNAQYEQANYEFDQNSDEYIGDLSEPFPQKRFLMLFCWDI